MPIVSNEAVALAFLAGLQFAWGDQGAKLRQELLEDATTQAVARLDSVVKQRITEEGQTSLLPSADIQSQIRKLTEARDKARSESDKLRYSNYIEALGWALNGANHA